MLFIYMHIYSFTFALKREPPAHLFARRRLQGRGSLSRPSEWARVHARRNRLSHCRQMWGRGGDGSRDSLRRRRATKLEHKDLERRHERWPGSGTHGARALARRPHVLKQPLHSPLAIYKSTYAIL